VVIFDLDRHDVVDLAGDFPLLHHHKKLVMLQGIENHETFDWGVEMGCHMFQGHFFQTPKQVVGRKLLGSQAMYFSLLREIHKPMMDYDKLEEIISKDAALVFKLLEYINSSAFHRRFRIRSVRHALSVLGEVEITKWVTFSLLSLVSTDKPPELLLTALIRAFFCHALAEKTANPALKNEAFFVGLMSVLDAMLDMSFSDIAKELPLSQRVLDAISGNGENELSVFLQLVQTYEDANWYKLHALAHKCSLNDLLLGELYLSAVCEADRTLTPSS
jgi:EAL and modified HD-GYP domain-containing signal transduction protein